MSNNIQLDALIAAIAAAINSLQTEDTGQLLTTTAQSLTPAQQEVVAINLGLTGGVTIAHLQQAITALQTVPVTVPLDENFAAEFAALLTDPIVKAAAIEAAQTVEASSPTPPTP